MRLHRFYIKEKIEAKTFFKKDVRPTEDSGISRFRGKEIRIESEDILHQMKNVFRLGVGDKIIFFNGEGKDFECKIEILSKKEGVFIIESQKKAFVPEKKIHVFLSAIRKERFEWAVEKCAELGVSSITPIITKRSEHTHLNIERLKKIAIEASEQCGRGDVPEISEPINFSDLNLDDSFIAFNMGGIDFQSFKLLAKSLKLLIGPEGGWSDEELEVFKNKNIKIYSLGNTVLRAETAAVVASALIFK